VNKPWPLARALGKDDLHLGRDLRFAIREKGKMRWLAKEWVAGLLLGLPLAQAGY